MHKVPLTLTLSRFVMGILVPVLICLDNDACTVIAVTLFVAGALSDAADGAIARRRSQQTKFGAFIDPIADKFMVFMVLITLVYKADSWIILALSLVIIAREIFVMSLREWVSSSGIIDTVKVSRYGKLKSVIQMCGISVLIIVPVVDNLYLYEISISILTLGAFVGLYSGFLYFKQPYKAGMLS
ncbi:MAG: CDP-diacylglycerol--glycerol-3-phosphate 3-phosphatidyltransferase [Chloroflexota bacterium]|nr:CDP-diacylglycerol--glycerol-3-phosphate 3-phosphatidyltransferase [Chloroflexota bacterium]